MFRKKANPDHWLNALILIKNLLRVCLLYTPTHNRNREKKKEKRKDKKKNENKHYTERIATTMRKIKKQNNNNTYSKPQKKKQKTSPTDRNWLHKKNTGTIHPKRHSPHVRPAHHMFFWQNKHI